MQKRQNWSKKPIEHMLQHGKATMPLNPSLQIDYTAVDLAAGSPAARSILLSLVILHEVAGSTAVADRAFKSPPFEPV